MEKYIEENNKIREKERKQNGEVFTPYEIIIKMLTELEKVYMREKGEKIYSNKSIKWYDSTVGIGNFMCVIYDKIYNELKEIGDKEREEYIKENMLYMSEMNEENYEKCKKYFGNRININLGDSLKIDIKKKWNIEGFDIIIGNPPYQKNNKKTDKARGGTNNNLYLDFIRDSINKLNEEGYLIYIHPQNWRKIGNNILKEMLKYKLEYIGLNYGGKLFNNISVNTDIYILKKTLNNQNHKTIVECYDKNNNLICKSSFRLGNIDFIPKYYTKEIRNIINKIKNKGINYNCIINSYCHKIREHVKKNNNKTEKHIYPLYNTSGNPFEYFSSKKHIDQDKKKVILSCSGKLEPYYDDGKYGTTQDSMYIIVKDEKEGNNIVKILNSSLYKFIIKICQWGNFRNEQKIFNYIKYPELTEDINDELINKYYELTKKELYIIDEINRLKN